MKTQKLIDLERDRLDLIAEARAILGKITDSTDAKNTAELERQHTVAMAKLDVNSLDIDEERMEAGKEADRASQRPDMSGEALGTDLTPSEQFARAWSGEGRTGWTDDKGQPVRVLRNTERMAESRQRVGVGLGDVVRAMVAGARTDAEKRALSEGTTTAGGYTVPAPLATWS